MVVTTLIKSHFSSVLEHYTLIGEWTEWILGSHICNLSILDSKVVSACIPVCAV